MGDRYGSRGGDTRPGDWHCYKCDVNNFARRNQCFKCQADKEDCVDDYGDEGYERGGGGGGGYKGGYGGRRGGYGGGGGYRGGYDDGYDDYGDDYGHRRMRNRSRSPPGRFGKRDRGGPDIRDGDWECFKCGFNNFARRDNCFKCGEPRSGGGGGGFRGGFKGRGFGGRGGGGGGDDNWRDGDWACKLPDCGQHNFARRDQCYKCGEPK